MLPGNGYLQHFELITAIGIAFLLRMRTCANACAEDISRS
jgi:hypothetical protein